MIVDPRLTRLRALVDRLERLPESTRKGWMLSEARARMVDVETGGSPRPMRPHQADIPAREPEPPGSPAANGGTVKGSSSTASSAAGPAPLDEAGGGRTSIAGPDVDEAALGTDGVLQLEDLSGDASAEPGNGAPAATPWRKGLRG